MRTWDISQQELAPEGQEELQGTPVHHSFGRGKWRQVAELTQLPRVALDSVIQQYGRDTWSNTAGAEVGGAVANMGGVRREEGIQRPKVSGRSRALRLRTSVSVRRPGGQQLNSTAGPKTTSAKTVSSDITETCRPSGGAELADSHQWPTPGESTTTGKWEMPALSRKAPPSPICPGRSGDDPLSSLPSSAVLSGSEGSEYYLEMADSSLELVEPLPASRLPDWPLDSNTVCFQNLPLSITSKELHQAIEPFGTLSHCAVLSAPNEAQLATAYVRMEKRSACDWVVSCFNGNPFNDSEQELVVFFCQ